VDVNTLEISLTQAGHPCPILIPGDPHDKVRDLPLDGGGLLGVFPDEVYPTTNFRLAPGDRMILHSDGIEVVLEEPNFDANLWRNELARRRNSDTPQMLADFANCLDRRSGSLQPKDDLTLIVIEATG
jgi:sigma-B regulation protein RsbU (phosphoserine phosphatase)